MKIGNAEFDWKARTYVMGIINVTPDSFSGDGILDEKDFVRAAVAQGKRFTEEGADILDIGGESTRPGSEIISEEEELRRVLPVIQALVKEVPVPLSIDTYKANVARAAIVAGASCINDIWAGTKDKEMYSVAAKANVPIILMHNSSAGQTVHSDSKLGQRFVGKESKDIVVDVSSALQQLAEEAQKVGVPHDNIILDPGFGFGKTVEQNLELMRRFNELTKLGYPLLAGVSRKSFVGYTLDLPPEERLEGSIAAAVMCAERGASILRVHDVKATRRALNLVNTVLN